MQPRNYLTQMLDNHKKCIPRLAASDVGNAKRFLAAARSAVCFSLPRSGRVLPNDALLLNIPLDAEGFARPPYQTIAVEFDVVCNDGSIEYVVVVVMGDEEKQGVVCIPSYKTPDPHDSWRLAAFGFFLPYKDLGLRAADGTWQHRVEFFSVLPDAVVGFAHKAGYTDVEDYLHFLYKESASHYILGYLHLCAALWTHKVSFEDVEPHEGHNKMRRALGKAPLFTYKVLTIGKKKRKSRHLGGTHASPRSHLRRGYYRTSRNGVRHWVQPCMVKGETDGFVHKDYKVEGTMH